MEKEKNLVPSDMAIGRRIYMIREEQVMIDRDLSELYGVENRALRQAVRRNEDKFPDDFLFKLTDDESKDVITKGVSRSVIPSGYNTGGLQMFGPKARQPQMRLPVDLPRGRRAGITSGARA